MSEEAIGCDALNSPPAAKRRVKVKHKVSREHRSAKQALENPEKRLSRRIESPAEVKRSEVKLKYEYSTQLKKNTAEMRTGHQMLLI